MTRTRTTGTWRTDGSGTTGWHGSWRIGRFQFGYHVYRHRYPKSSDRWVFQPSLIVDL